MCDRSRSGGGCRRVAAAATVGIAAGIAPAQSAWIRAVPGYASWRATAYDPVRRQVMVHGGQNLVGFLDETWFWTGTRWVGARPATSAGVFSSQVAMVADAARNEVLLLGSRDGVGQETWTWNGVDWTRRSPAAQPPVLTGSALASDSLRGRVVCFGGFLGSAPTAQTWEWDGATWTRRMPAHEPGPRVAHAMAFDAARGRTVLFGGTLGGPPLGDTWEWDGTDWLLRAPATSPPRRGYHAMAYDGARQRVVMYGGITMPANDVATWEWDGATWQQRVTATVPRTSLASVMVEDAARGRIVVPDTARQGTWEWDGQDWTLVAPVAPSLRWGGAMTFEPVRGRALAFGGTDGVGTFFDDTWEWDGEGWAQRTMAVAPAPRAEHAIAHDPVRGTTMVFGGRLQAQLLGDTWEWDGATWSPAAVSFAPGPRSGHAMTFDPALQQVLLFGGHDGAALLDDTWAWNGVVWTRLQPAVRPPARWQTGMAWDAVSQATLLFGGRSVAGATTVPLALDDTWRFAGGTWQQVLPATRPPARWSFGIAADPLRGVVVVQGGQDPSFGGLDDTWQWDGSDWSRVVTTTSPRRDRHAMAFDMFRRQFVSHGGYSASLLDDTLLHGTAGLHAVYGAGCAGTLGVPALTPAPVSVPAFGGRVAATVASVPSGLAAMAVEVVSPFAAVPAAPVPLGAFGMPGCGAWLAPALLVPLVASAGVANWQLDVPWVMALNGMQLFQQAIVLDPAANAAGLTVSNAARIRIGN